MLNQRPETQGGGGGGKGEEGEHSRGGFFSLEVEGEGRGRVTHRRGKSVGWVRETRGVREPNGTERAREREGSAAGERERARKRGRKRARVRETEESANANPRVLYHSVGSVSHASRASCCQASVPPDPPR